MMPNRYWVYIMSSYRGVLYTGVTNNLERRVWEHKHSTEPSFTRTYRVNRLVYIEEFGNVLDAIESEKRIKGWLRIRKLELIKTRNPKMLDLSEGWYG